jgi:hypothetical protein
VSPSPSECSRCPAQRRASSFRGGLGALLGIVLTVGCSFIPEPVGGIPESLHEPWVTLPLRTWLAEERAVPEAVALCAPPACSPALVIGVVRLTGEEAEAAERILQDPASLARALSGPRPEAAPKDPRRARSVASVVPLREGSLRGLAVALAREDGTRPAHGAALARRVGASLRVVLVVGAEEEAVLDAARRAAAAHLDS